VNVAFSPLTWQQFLAWLAEDPDVFRRILALIDDVRRLPFTGLGKPEPLKGNLAGYWSRRITAEHRLIYRVRCGGDAQQVAVAQCRHHYR
jgi:toxin YoeB